MAEEKKPKAAPATKEDDKVTAVKEMIAAKLKAGEKSVAMYFPAGYRLINEESVFEANVPVEIPKSLVEKYLKRGGVIAEDGKLPASAKQESPKPVVPVDVDDQPLPKPPEEKPSEQKAPEQKPAGQKPAAVKQ